MNKNYVFPKVDLKEQPRTNFDLSHTIRTSFAPCLSIPIMDIETIPTDSFYAKIQSIIESMPMVAPAMGRWKARFLFFENPLSNMYSWMDNNEKLTTEEWLNRSCHTFVYRGLNGLVDNPTHPATNIPVGVQPGSLLNMLGFPVGFVGIDWVLNNNEVVVRNLPSNTFNAEGIITYFDIVRNYLVNNQQQNFPMIVCNDNSFSSQDESASPVIKYYPLAVLDDWMKSLRMNQDGVEQIFDDSKYGFFYDTTGQLPSFLDDLSYSHLVPSGGLVCTPYLMDFNRGIMNASVGSIEAKVSVTTTDEELMQFAIPSLRFANKMQNLVDRLDLSGGRWTDVLSTVWRAHLKGSVDRPIFVGSRSEWIYMQDIISTTTTQSESTPSGTVLGQQGGFVSGKTDSKKPVCNFDFNEYGRFMCIFQLIPDVDYSSGLDLQLFKRTFSDKYIPQYAQIGWQDVSNYELMALPSSYNSSVGAFYPAVSVDGPSQKVGVRVAWSEYTCKLDKVYGDFAQGGKLDYWVLLRRYRLSTNNFSDNAEPETNVDYTTYAYPYLFNYLFIDQDLKTHNFRLQTYFDIKAKRPLPRRSMPRL